MERVMSDPRDEMLKHRRIMEDLETPEQEYEDLSWEDLGIDSGMHDDDPSPYSGTYGEE
jgi:hypothetical protein